MRKLDAPFKESNIILQLKSKLRYIKLIIQAVFFSYKRQHAALTCNIPNKKYVFFKLMNNTIINLQTFVLIRKSLSHRK